MNRICEKGKALLSRLNYHTFQYYYVDFTLSNKTRADALTVHGQKMNSNSVFTKQAQIYTT